MKILNITLSIIIFLLAAASAMFSYFLFEKRAQFVSSHNAMAAAIRENSVALDPESDITLEKLDHYKHEDLGNQLETFSKQVRAVIEQRNRMGDALFNIAGNVGVRPNPSREEYRQIASTEGNLKRVQDQVHRVIVARDGTNAALVKLARRYGFALQTTALNSAFDQSASDAALSPLSKFIQSILTLKETYRKAFSQIALAAGARVDVQDKKASAGINAVLAAVRKKSAEVATLSRKLRETLAENRGLAQKNRAQARQLDASAKRYAASQKALRDLKTSIGVSQDFVGWQPGSLEARSRLFGKVTGISTEYGYFVVNLGSRSVVYQVNNGKRLPVKLNLDENVELLVIRGTSENSDPSAWIGKDGAVVDSTVLAKRDEYVTSSRIKRVGENECILDIPVGADVRVGDIVLFKRVVK